MPRFPKLKVKLPCAGVSDEICGLDNVEYHFDYENSEFLITVEGQEAHSYNEQMRLAKQDCYRD